MKEYVAKTQFGLEEVLEKELLSLGAINTKILSRAVRFEADLETVYIIHLWSSSALRIIEPIYTFEARDTETLYQRIKDVDWSMIMQIDHTFKIDAVVYSSFFTHSQYAGLKMKDAICDFFREETGKRPDIDVRKPNFTFILNIWEDQVQLAIDLTGEPLFKRRYRSQSSEAPLNEVLAAGILEMTNWDRKMPLLDGMCGSGTMLIEALFKATNTAASIERKNYAFMFHPDYDAKLWYQVLDEAKESRDEENYPNIKGLEIDERTYNTAKENLVRAGFKPIFHLENGNFFKYKPKEKEGVLVMNPPYDMRLKSKDINKLYKEIGDHLKKNFKGWTAFILSGNEEARKSIGLKPAQRIKLFNGKIECRLLKFELY